MDAYQSMYLPTLLLGVGLYGAYVMLFGLAIWTTYQHNSIASAWMRVPLLLMLFDLTAVLALTVAHFQIVLTDGDHLRDWMTLPLQIGINVATCIAGLLSDGLLAWRAFVVFGRQPWMKWVLITVILTNFATGSLANIAYTYEIRSQQMQVDQDPDNNIGNFLKISQLGFQGSTTAQWLIDAWAWIFFAINSSLTSSIMYKIISATEASTMLRDSHEGRSIYRTVVRAIIESSLITWVVLLVYSISNTIFYALNEMGAYNASLSSQYAFTVLPFIFGISQSLIIARIGMSRLQTPAAVVKHTALVFANSSRAEVRTELVIKGGIFPEDVERGAMDSNCVDRTAAARIDDSTSSIT